MRLLITGLNIVSKIATFADANPNWITLSA
jgi:hypothetical protein